MGRGSKVEVVGEGSRCYEGNPCLVSWLDISELDLSIKETVNKQCLRGAPLIHSFSYRRTYVTQRTVGFLPVLT